MVGPSSLLALIAPQLVRALYIVYCNIYWLLCSTINTIFCVQIVKQPIFLTKCYWFLYTTYKWNELLPRKRNVRTRRVHYSRQSDTFMTTTKTVSPTNVIPRQLIGYHNGHSSLAPTLLFNLRHSIYSDSNTAVHKGLQITEDFSKNNHVFCNVVT